MDISNIISVQSSLRIHPEWTNKAYGSELNRESWFKLRSRLFRNTLLASIRRQTVQPKRIFLMMDRADEQLYSKYLNINDPLFQPIFQNHLSEIAREIHQNHPANVACSRIDSDDIIAPDYLEKVNSAIVSSLRSGVQFEYVVACSGIRTDLREMQEIYYGCPPFLTLFESSYSGKEVYGFNHELVEEKPLIKDRLARWAQIIHGQNISNDFVEGGLQPKDFDRVATTSAKLIAKARTMLSPDMVELFGLPASLSAPPWCAPAQDLSMPKGGQGEPRETPSDSLAGLLGLAARQRAAGRHRDALALIEQACGLEPDHIGARIALQSMQRQLERRPATLLGPPVCLTAISHRLHTLPRVVASLLRQTLPPAMIHLYVSEEPYLLDAGVRPDDAALQSLATLPRLQIHWVPNLGPYRKLVPYLASPVQPVAGCVDPQLFITADDDTLYPPRFIEYLIRKRQTLGGIVAHRGRRIRPTAEASGRDAFLPYTQWHDGLNAPRLANLPTGQSGVLYHRNDFPDDLQLEAALVLAPTHDDLWLRWLMARRGIEASILQPNAAARTPEFSFPSAGAGKDYASVSLWFAYNAPEAPGGSSTNDAAVAAIDTFFRASGFDLARVLRQERERHAEFY